MAADKSEQGFIAAVDLGSNSFHMIVAQQLDGELRLKDRLREMVRLAAGLDERGNLDAASRQRAVECLQRFGQRLRELPPGSVRAVGTNTLRKARGGDFLQQAEEALGHPIEVISGVEEARLIYLGVSHGLPDSEAMRLVVDIGGGSTELILGRRFEPLEMESLYMGCVSFSERFFADGKVSDRAMRQALIAARLELQSMEREYRDIGWGEVIGASGTIKAVGETVQANGWSQEGITLESLHRLSQALVDAGDVSNLKLAGLKEERLPVIAGGVAVLRAIFEALQIERMQVSDWALREGLLYDQLGRIRHEDVRERTISRLSESYFVDTRQAARVEQTAAQILSQVAAAWLLQGEECEHLLLWAARLHEIGLGIAHSQYHKHGAYLLENSDMPGFSTTEQRQLAMLVRLHRRKYTASLFKELPEEQRRRLRYLSIILRLAVLLHRSHSDAPLPPITFCPEEKGLALAFPDGWLAEHPLTQADLEQEVALLHGAKFSLSFS